AAPCGGGGKARRHAGRGGLGGHRRRRARRADAPVSGTPEAAVAAAATAPARAAGGCPVSAAAHSTFCTCSRICSISTFISTARRVVARSCDLDDRVLASRLN